MVDLDALRNDLAGHAAIARALVPYKLSLHSGSDKLSVYPIIVDVTHGLVPLKTAGTSYLEALRVVGRIDPSLFREILAWGRERYAQDRVSYHVSADLNRVPAAADMPDEDLPELLDDSDTRQVLHVTFGSTLAAFGAQILRLLIINEEAYTKAVEVHFVRHLEPFIQSGA